MHFPTPALILKEIQQTKTKEVYCMKTIRILFLAAAMLIFAASAAMAGAQDFILVNRTGYDIYAVNVSPSETEKWEEDILGSQILSNGEALEVKFGKRKERYWDIQVKFKDGSGLYWMRLDLMNTKVIALNGDGTATME